MRVWERIMSNGDAVYDVSEAQDTSCVVVTRKIGDDFSKSRLLEVADQVYVPYSLLVEWCTGDVNLAKEHLASAKRVGRYIETLAGLGVVVMLGAPVWLSEPEMRHKVEDMLSGFTPKTRRQLAEAVAEVIAQNNEALHRFLRMKGLI